MKQEKNYWRIKDLENKKQLLQIVKIISNRKLGKRVIRYKLEYFQESKQNNKEMKNRQRKEKRSV